MVPLRSPFSRLRALLAGLDPGQKPITLAVGEPQRQALPQAIACLAAAAPQDYAKYPPIEGTDDFYAAAAGWLERRFGIHKVARQQILPLAGTREGLFLAAQCAMQPLARDKPAQTTRPLMAMPDPFYQLYAAAALAAGADPLYLPTTLDNNFLPDLDAIDDALWPRLGAFYLCNPGNPQGAVADAAYIQALLIRARQYKFLLVVDECYIDLYGQALASRPPMSALRIAQNAGDTDPPLLCFFSLSKRSNLAGMRSGFCAGGMSVMTQFLELRMLVGPQTSLPIQAAASLAWQDDNHVADNRSFYDERFQDAERLLAPGFRVRRPQAGFFLWLHVGDGEQAARLFWDVGGVSVLPGKYLRQENTEADAYVRLALVHNKDQTAEALTRIAKLADQVTPSAKVVTQ